MSRQLTLDIFDTLISSQELADGHLLSRLPDGQLSGRYGQEVVRASRTQERGKGKGIPIDVISGPSSGDSSPSAGLQRSLESRLRARLAVDGSPEFALTWKHWDMSSGPQICALRAWARRIGGSDCFGELSGWGTPSERDWKDAEPAFEVNPGMVRVESRLARQVMLSGWATPTVNDSRGGRNSTATRSDPNSQHHPGETLVDMAELASGPLSTSSPAETAKRGVLNAAHSRWLMGYPAAWDGCAGTAMPSFHKLRLSS